MARKGCEAGMLEEYLDQNPNGAAYLRELRKHAFILLKHLYCDNT
jgi:hypothetical protein